MSAKRIAHYGLLTSMTLVLGFIERQFVLVPAAPNIRLGLSNAVLLYALCLMGAKSAWLLMFAKVLLSGFLFAGVNSMMYSLSGGVLSMLAMAFALFTGGFGFVGVSVLGAVFHMLGQLLLYRVMLSSWAAFVQAPLLLAAAVATGTLTGIAAHASCQALARGDAAMQSRLQTFGRARRKEQ